MIFVNFFKIIFISIYYCKSSIHSFLKHFFLLFVDKTWFVKNLYFFAVSFENHYLISSSAKNITSGLETVFFSFYCWKHFFFRFVKIFLTNKRSWMKIGVRLLNSLKNILYNGIIKWKLNYLLTLVTHMITHMISLLRENGNFKKC